MNINIKITYVCHGLSATCFLTVFFVQVEMTWCGLNTEHWSLLCKVLLQTAALDGHPVRDQ